MRNHLPTLAVLLTIYATPAVLSAQSTDPLDSLIRQLADDSFTARIEAYQQLRDHGEAALPALRRAAGSQDLEIRCQAERLLGVIEASTFDERLARFLDGDRNVTLPGWPPFRKLCGDDDKSRDMFVDMLRAEPALWRCCSTKASVVAREVQSRCQQIKSDNTYRRRRRADWQTVCSLLMCTAGESDAIDYQDHFVVYNLASHGALDDLLEDDERGPKVRRLMANWISRGTDRSAILRFQLGYHFQLEASLDPALQLLGSGREKYIHHKAMLVVAAYGRPEHLPVVAPYLDDDTILFKRADTGYTCQSRDAALLTSLHLLGKQPRDFGFTHLKPNSFHLHEYNSIGFTDLKTRNAALAAWRTLQASESTSGNRNGSAGR